MSEIEQISNVLLRYASGIDSRDWNLFRTCFTEDAQLDYGVLGHWNSADAVTRFMEVSHSGPSQHRLSNFDITITGNQARARSYVDAIVLRPGGWGGAQTIGYYDDELVQTSAGWKIARRRYVSLRMKLLGLLSIVPPGMALRLAALGTKRFSTLAAAKAAQR